MEEIDLLPFKFRRLPDGSVAAVSASGQLSILNSRELESLVRAPADLPLRKIAELQSKHFLMRRGAAGSYRLMLSRIASKNSTLLAGPSLHILVPTLQCEHTCRYCQVSRSLEADGFAMSVEDINAACDTVLQSPSDAITVEFQGGDPLIRFDLIKIAVNRLSQNVDSKRSIRFVVTSTLHQLTAEMCDFFRENGVVLSTSIDGPSSVHNKNRPLPSRDSYERTVAGIQLARQRIGSGAVAALMTTTKESLKCPTEIVDEYVHLGLSEIVVRPLSPFGFAKRGVSTQKVLLDEFLSFYSKVFERVLYWNSAGVDIREGYAALLLSKLLSSTDSGYVDLQSVSAGGLSVLVYNYDGYVYPSDEARMLVEMGDISLRLGKIGESLQTLLESPVMSDLVKAGTSWTDPGCMECAYGGLCSPDPISAKGEWGNFNVPVAWTEHCGRSLSMYDFLIQKLSSVDTATLRLLHRWARPGVHREAAA